MSFTLYRKCSLGETLSETVNELKRNHKITDALGEKIMETFDKVR